MAVQPSARHLSSVLILSLTLAREWSNCRRFLPRRVAECHIPKMSSRSLLPVLRQPPPPRCLPKNKKESDCVSSMLRELVFAVGSYPQMPERGVAKRRGWEGATKRGSPPPWASPPTRPGSTSAAAAARHQPQNCFWLHWKARWDPDTPPPTHGGGVVCASSWKKVQAGKKSAGWTQLRGRLPSKVLR